MELIQQVKHVIATEFTQERTKDRGANTIAIGDALTAIEIEIKKKLSDLSKGKTIAELYPEN